MTPTIHNVQQGSEESTKRRRCANCGELAQGNYSIHRDGFGVGPEVDLCDSCGGHELPTCETIWANIAARRAQ